MFVLGTLTLLLGCWENRESRWGMQVRLLSFMSNMLAWKRFCTSRKLKKSPGCVSAVERHVKGSTQTLFDIDTLCSSGIAGYTKAKLPPPPPTMVQAALLAVHSQESLDVMDKLTRNVAVNPSGENPSPARECDVSPRNCYYCMCKKRLCAAMTELLHIPLLPVAFAEEKYRRVRLSNAKVQAALVNTPGALDALLTMGWAQEGEGEDAALVVPKGRFFTMADVSAPRLAARECRSHCRKRTLVLQVPSGTAPAC